MSTPFKQAKKEIIMSIEDESGYGMARSSKVQSQSGYCRKLEEAVDGLINSVEGNGSSFKVSREAYFRLLDVRNKVA